MYSLLLVIIYIAFISLGLPDSLLGSAWPVIHGSLGVPVSFAGIVSMIIAGGTIISSLLSDRLTKKLGAGLVTASSVLLTAAALFGFSVSDSFWMLCLWAIPYGLGAGAVDAALNNYVALHYASRHMSWLHCFWGVGAAISPYIMSYALTSGNGWSSGYGWVAAIQGVLTAVLFVSLPLWRRRREDGDGNGRIIRIKDAVRIKGVVYVLAAFFSYCALETTTGLWASSYLVQNRGTDPVTAAGFASLFYLGITAGRLICGFAADRIGDKTLIRTGIYVLTAGVVMICVPCQWQPLPLAGLLVIGFGCAPIYPSFIHSTPSSFGRENSQAIIGIQMASAYAGSTFMSPLFGWISGFTGIWLYPFYLLVFALLMLVMSELLNKSLAKQD
jgi:fucose permease